MYYNKKINSNYCKTLISTVRYYLENCELTQQKLYKDWETLLSYCFSSLSISGNKKIKAARGDTVLNRFNPNVYMGTRTEMRWLGCFPGLHWYRDYSGSILWCQKENRRRKINEFSLIISMDFSLFDSFVAFWKLQEV